MVAVFGLGFFAMPTWVFSSLLVYILEAVELILVFVHWTTEANATCTVQ